MFIIPKPIGIYVKCKNLKRSKVFFCHNCTCYYWFCGTYYTEMFTNTRMSGKWEGSDVGTASLSASTTKNQMVQKETMEKWVIRQPLLQKRTLSLIQPSSANSGISVILSNFSFLFYCNSHCFVVPRQNSHNNVAPYHSSGQ